MSYVPTEQEIERIRTLIEKSDLEGIFFHEFNARRWDQTPEDLGEEDARTLDIGVQYRHGEEDFGIRLNARLRNSTGEAVVSVAGEYSLDDYAPTKRDVLLFANEVAVMTLFPYLREGVSELTNRVFGDAVLLPVAPRGAIAVELDEEQDA